MHSDHLLLSSVEPLCQINECSIDKYWMHCQKHLPTQLQREQTSKHVLHNRLSRRQYRGGVHPVLSTPTVHSIVFYCTANAAIREAPSERISTERRGTYSVIKGLLGTAFVDDIKCQAIAKRTMQFHANNPLESPVLRTLRHFFLDLFRHTYFLKKGLHVFTQEWMRVEELS